MSRIPLHRRLAFGGATLLMAASLWAVLYRVDLTPQVESDFFFSTDDPAFQASREIGKRFPSRPQVVIAARGAGAEDAGYVDSVRGLTKELAATPGVASIQSLTSGPSSPAVVAASPLWSRLLLTGDPSVTQLVLSVEEDGGSALVGRIEAVLARHRRGDFELEASGVPVVVELIRRHLQRDLRIFSSAAIGVFGLVILLVYRSWPLVVGTLLSCCGACLLTLTALSLLGTPIGLLTANIATIVFVLTLSHTVFLSANWRRLAGELPPTEAVERAVRITFVASFWCMVAALLGFGSLLLASARPLRELGVSGVVGTTTAIVVAYSFYPLFLSLGNAAPSGRLGSRLGAPRLPSGWTSGLVAALLVIAAAGLPRIDTDPSLLTYFDDDSDIRSGLELVDRLGGSSPLQLMVSDPNGERLDSKENDARLAALQKAIDGEPAVGTSLSLAVLLAEARTVPLAAFFSPAQIVDILSSERYQNIGRTFVDEERRTALFMLRMREGGRNEERAAIERRLEQAVDAAGLRLDRLGGLYDLQGQLGVLVRASLSRELGGLLLFFVAVAWLVSRSARAAAAMVGCLAAIPLLLLGAVGHLGQPVDVISAPGANVAIALGIDAMIHLVMAVRRRRQAGGDLRLAWAEACGQQRPAILGAMAILAAGFGIFVLSSFPPTRRFGVLVASGFLASALLSLRVLPFLAAPRQPAAANEGPPLPA